KTDRNRETGTVGIQSSVAASAATDDLFGEAGRGRPDGDFAGARDRHSAQRHLRPSATPGARSPAASRHAAPRQGHRQATRLKRSYVQELAKRGAQETISIEAGSPQHADERDDDARLAGA